MIGDSPVVPPVVRLGRELGWEPLPLSVRDARRMAGPTRQRLGDMRLPPVRRAAADGPNTVRAGKVTVAYGGLVAVREVDLALRPGSVTALMGRNGSGKSSLLWALQGAQQRRSGHVDVLGTDPAQLSADEARRLISLVPQSAADLLYLETVAAECAAADLGAGATPGTCRAMLDRLVPGVPSAHHPRDLSEGQRLALALAVQLTAGPAVLLLDEPTRGLDYLAKEQLVAALDALATQGRSVLVATHDVEFVAQVADRVVVMAQGEIIADGPTSDVVGSSPIFAPQVAKVLAPRAWLTVEQVRASLTGGP